LVFFNFGRIYFDISSISGSSVNVITGTIVKGKGFGISDLSKVPETYINYVLDLKYFNSPGTCLIYMLLDILLYVVLTLYFDNVIPNEFGNRQPFYYFLLPSYWGISKSDSNSPNEWVKNTLDKYPPTYDKNKIDSDVLDHINYTCDSNNNDPIKVINLMKKYGRGKDEKVVVNGSYLSFSKDKVVVFLGQNGAGKSTTINIMAGLTPPNGGDVSVFGKNLKNDLNGVQRELGICPQNDILYADMTAMEHLLLYTGLKGVTTSNLDKILEQRLKAVKLWTVKDARTNTYSGGMKRRLSMIIATIGDPSVVLLDEPTTGMDPLNRRHVWRFIEKFKKNRCIVVTTHSMEEADALGDEIIIMANGDIKAIGNGVHLKNKFGAGYRISMIAKDKKINEIKEKVQEYVPGAKMEDDSAGALIYNFTKEQLQYIPKFIKYLDENPDNLISNWGISQTTLEEVFLLVIQETSNRKIKDE
jgi:ABC-type multidrug transport system ATPase subunit